MNCTWKKFLKPLNTRPNAMEHTEQKRIFFIFGFHKMHTMKAIFIQTIIFICLTLVGSSCANHPSPSLSADQAAVVKESVQKMMDSISQDISAKGPMAWIHYFENKPDFSMASDGQLQFADYASAKSFISDVLTKNMHKIDLRWNHIRIDPLTTSLASIGADFHEDITMADQKTMAYDGYFTGTAEHGSKGWQLRNAHWSMKK